MVHPGLTHKEWKKMESDKKVRATDNKKWGTPGLQEDMKAFALTRKKAKDRVRKKRLNMAQFKIAIAKKKSDTTDKPVSVKEAIGDGKKKSKVARKMDIAVSKIDRAFRNKKSNPPGSARAKQRVNSAAFGIRMGRDPEELKKSPYHTKADVRSAQTFLRKGLWREFRFDTLNELKKDTLKSYIKKAGEDVRRTEYQKGRAGERYAQANVDMQNADPKNPKRNERQLAARRKAQAVADYNKLGPRTTKRMKGIAKALGKLEEESVEVNELTKKTLRSYLAKASKSLRDGSAKHKGKRVFGMMKALRQTNEDMSKYDSYDDWRTAGFPKKKIKKKMTKIKLAKGTEIGWEMKDAATGKVLKKGGPPVR